MRYVLGYAIPAEAYDHIYRMKGPLTNGNVEFEGRSIGRAGSPIDPKHARFFLQRFQEHAIKNRGDHKLELGFAVIYVRSDQESAAIFEESFFPSTLAFPIDWRLTGYSPKEINESNNELFRLLLKATIQARIAITAFRKELVERANRTPLLLPQRNFRSIHLHTLIRKLQATIPSQSNVSDADALIKAEVKQFEKHHPMKMVEDPKRKHPCYLDDHNVEFHAPGKALHGIPHAIDGHPANCILGGYRRLGAPFNPSFHYDCVKGARQNLRGLFYRCHGTDAEVMEGNKHINIAPNDFIRI